MIFQYSLCRVVLMVHCLAHETPRRHLLSVLALSSRFDGRLIAVACLAGNSPFSTRSVESF